MTARPLLVTPLLLSCSLWGTPLPDPDCAHVAIDADAELLITDAWLRHDARAKNADRGNLSFTAQLAPYDTSAFWRLVGVAEPPAADTPFRLLALVNRTDLAQQLAPESLAGEARFVYTLTAGPGDEHGAEALSLTVIVEYSLGTARSAASWASSFHQLALASPAQRRDVTAALFASIAAPNDAPGAAHLSQIRINDARFGTPRLYELAPGTDGVLTQRGLRNTPRVALARTPELTTFIHDQAAAIRSGTHRVPTDWLAESALLEEVAWQPRDDEVTHAFARGTCNGCHGTEGPSQNGFHLAQSADGSVTRSPFITEEELPRRATEMRQRLCE